MTRAAAVVFLLLVPFVYGAIRDRQRRQYNPQLDVLIVAVACWGIAIGIIITEVLWL